MRNPLRVPSWLAEAAQHTCGAIALACGLAYGLVHDDAAGLACLVATYFWCASVDAERGDA